jgi:hypothetical protein
MLQQTSVLDYLTPEAATEAQFLQVRTVATTGVSAKYRYNVIQYVEERLGWSPWRGNGSGRPGQAEILEAYELSLHQQHERKDFNAGVITREQLKYWTPGQRIKTHFAVDAGHNVGKTKLASAFVNHFLDTCIPSIINTYAPSKEQIHDLLWKEIKVDRRDKGLPGRILDLEVRLDDNHFAKGKATNDAHGTARERTHGQHNPYLMFVLDEAEGIPKSTWDSVESMTSGGIYIVLILRNPRTHTSLAHKIRKEPYCEPFRISCLYHPNVLANKELVPNSVSRDYVHSMLRHCIVVDKHEDETHTFELPWQPGVIWKPGIEWLWRVAGIPASQRADRTFCPITRFEAATQRPIGNTDPANVARVGVDVARFGDDYGTVYMRYHNSVWRVAQLYQLDTTQYAYTVRDAILDLVRETDGVVNDVVVRVDGGGGFGGGVVDQLRRSLQLKNKLKYFEVWEVNFNGRAFDESRFSDLATEMYYHTGAELEEELTLVEVPEELQTDICERTWKYVGVTGQAAKRLADGPNGPHTVTAWYKHEVKKLETKDKFRGDFSRSPDDGDGCVLAVAPDYVFEGVLADGLIRLVHDTVEIGVPAGVGSPGF